eukprot:c24699_g1_i1 orf=40-198(+)
MGITHHDSRVSDFGILGTSSIESITVISHPIRILSPGSCCQFLSFHPSLMTS